MSQSNDDQKVFWEGFAQLWVANQSDLDALMAPVLDGVFERADLRPGQSVLDIGCGTGTSSIRAAELVGPQGRVIGADISDPMLHLARKRSEDINNLQFNTTDVASHPFPPGEFDRVISRFGVMFFADPVMAFSNVLKSMKPGAQLCMACWSVLDANPWFRAPMYAAKAQLGAPPAVDADAPGPLAFRDIARVVGILDAAGFSAPQGTVQSLSLTPKGDLHQVASHAASIGPAARAIEYFDASQEDVAAIVDSVARVFAPFESPDGFRVPAEINYFTARAPT